MIIIYWIICQLKIIQIIWKNTHTHTHTERERERERERARERERGLLAQHLTSRWCHGPVGRLVTTNGCVGGGDAPQRAPRWTRAPWTGIRRTRLDRTARGSEGLGGELPRAVTTEGDRRIEEQGFGVDLQFFKREFICLGRGLLRR
jgi:hypothetical protein